MSFLHDDWIVLRLESTVEEVSARNREQRDEVDLLVEEVNEAELIALDGADMRARLFRVSPAVTRCTESIVYVTKSEFVLEKVQGRLTRSDGYLSTRR